MQPPKGKPPTKGAKQILMENSATVRFYLNMSLGAIAVYGIVSVIFYMENLTIGIIFLNILLLSIYTGCYQIMKYISRPTYSDNSHLIDPGLDLNMEGSLGEHVKDVVILSSMTHVLAAVSNYFWWLLLLLPLRAFWLLWTNVLGPWFFQEAPLETEQDEKKKMKLERKMKRHKE